MHLCLKSDSLTFNQSLLGHHSAQHGVLKSVQEASEFVERKHLKFSKKWNLRLKINMHWRGAVDKREFEACKKKNKERTQTQESKNRTSRCCHANDLLQL